MSYEDECRQNMVDFHNHETGNDAEGRATQAWLAWCERVEALLGCDLDGDQAVDGFSLDGFYEDWRKGLSAEDAVDAAQERIAGLA